MGRLVNICAGASLKNMPSANMPAMLINVPGHGATARRIATTKVMLQESNPEILVVDCGGYQFYLGEQKNKHLTFDPKAPLKYNGKAVNIAPEHIAKCAKEFVPECRQLISIGLDWPVRKRKTPAEKEVEFRKKLLYNAPWAVESEFWIRRYCPQAQYFMPIQCYDIDQLSVFLATVHGQASPDGVSMPIRNLKLWEIALFGVAFYQKGFSRLHLLGTSSFFVVALCAYMARHMFEWVSLDASTWNAAAIYGGYSNPWDLSREDLRPYVQISPEIRNECICPHCAGAPFAEIQKMESRQKVALLRRHNWWALEKAFRDLYSAAGSLCSLTKFLESRSKDQKRVQELISALLWVDPLKDGDIRTLRDCLAFKPVKRKPSKASRRQSVPA
jgi:hypothetical protein